MRREPSHILIEPDQQRAALAQCSVVVRPVRRTVAGGRWLSRCVRSQVLMIFDPDAALQTQKRFPCSVVSA